MKKDFLLIASLFITFTSCNKEEEVEPPRELSVQVIADEQSLEDFLSTHFYNYEDFQNDAIQPELVFDSIAGENSGKIPLINQVKKTNIRIKNNEGDFVDHPLYTLVAREGIGEIPTKVDSTYLSYEGILLNKNTFDRSIAPIWFDLTSVVRGFREGMPVLKSGEFTVDDNNIPTFSNYGQGAIFFPSGLGYYNAPTGLIPAYSPLIFKINLYLIKRTYHDGDGIPSSEEYDRDQDGIPDDTDEDGLPDFVDPD